MDLVMVTSDAV